MQVDERVQEGCEAEASVAGLSLRAPSHSPHPTPIPHTHPICQPFRRPGFSSFSPRVFILEAVQ